MKLKLIELFAGIGSQATALKRLNIPFQHYIVVEFDKYAIKSYNAIHGTNFDPTDIRDISGKDLEIDDTDNNLYLVTYSFPCQDLSVAGKGLGMSKDSGTRSGLLWEVERLLNECDNLPQVLLMENVTQVHGKRHIDDFNKWIKFLEDKGYKNYCQDLNAKDYGVPQNRNRTFMLSIRGDNIYEFPKPFQLTQCVSDYLENAVDKRFYIDTDKSRKLIVDIIKNGDENTTDKALGNLTPKDNNKIHQRNWVYNEKGNSPTLTSTMYKDPPRIFIRQATKKGYTEVKHGGVADLSYPTSKTRRGRVQGGGDICPTLTASDPNICKIESQYCIRKLTPRECWRLMGFTDEEFEKAEKVNSNTQLYKQAGNSIVVNVLVEIFSKLFKLT